MKILYILRFRDVLEFSIILRFLKFFEILFLQNYALSIILIIYWKIIKTTYNTYKLICIFLFLCLDSGSTSSLMLSIKLSSIENMDERVDIDCNDENASHGRLNTYLIISHSMYLKMYT